MKLLGFFIFACFIFTNTAQAGFEWVPAEKNDPVNVIRPAPSPTVNLEPLTPAVPAPVTRQHVLQAPQGHNAPVNLAPPPPITSSSKPDAVIQSRTLRIPPGAQEHILPPPSYQDNRPSAKKTDEITETFGVLPRVMNRSSGAQTGQNKEGLINMDWLGQNPKNPQQAAWMKGEVRAEHSSLNTPQQTRRSMAPRSPTMQPLSQSADHYAIVEGFASDLPLALALRQVVPPVYSFSFGPGVNPGLRVSWNGGKPWNIIVQNMVDPLSMNAFLSGRSLRFELKQTQGSKTTSLMQPAPLSYTPQNMSAPETLRRQNVRDPGMPAPISLSNAQPIPMSGPANLKARAARPRMSEQIQNELKQENIEMRMSERDFLRPNSQAQPLESGRPYSIDPYTPYDLETVSQKKAAFNQTAPYTRKLMANSGGQLWEAKRGDSLKTTLVDWSRKANINLVWNASRDYTLASNVLVNGSFNSAIAAILSDGIAGRQKPSVRLVDNPSANTPTTFIVGDQV